MFKKKSGDRPLRKRLREDEVEEKEEAVGGATVDGVDGEEDNRPLSEKLADTKLAQQLRQRRAGLDHNKMALGVREVSQEPDDAAATLEAAGLQNNFEAKGKHRHGDNDADDDDNPHLKQFIEQRMAEKRARLGDTSTDPFKRDAAAAAAAAGAAAQDERFTDEMLYHVPNHLKGMEKRDLNSEAAGWLTGIQEVRLAKEFKMKNIEETEAMKRRLLEKAEERASAAADEDEDRLPRMHTRLWMMPRQFGRGAQYKGQSDTAVARRFKDRQFKEAAMAAPGKKEGTGGPGGA